MKHSDDDKLFVDATKKLDHELDICEILKFIRITKLVVQLYTKGRQRELVKFFDHYTVKMNETEDDGGTTSDSGVNEEIARQSNRNIHERDDYGASTGLNEAPVHCIKEVLLDNFSPEGDKIDKGILKAMT